MDTKPSPEDVESLLAEVDSVRKELEQSDVLKIHRHGPIDRLLPKLRAALSTAHKQGMEDILELREFAASVIDGAARVSQAEEIIDKLDRLIRDTAKTHPCPIPHDTCNVCDAIRQSKEKK